jgi:hypothetical protein
VAVGYDSVFGVLRTLLKFNGLSDGTIPANATVSSAVLSFTVALFNTKTIYVYRQKRPWDEFLSTWEGYDDVNAWTNVGGFGASDCEQTNIGSHVFSPSDLNHSVNFALSSTAIQQMVSGSFVNNGFLLKSDIEGSGGAVAFLSRENGNAAYSPQLIITYATP